MPSLPSYLKLSSNYPNGTPDQVKALIGGKINSPWLTNTCAVRLSCAFNYAGETHQIPGPGNVYGLSVVSGNDTKWYAYRVTEFAEYLRKRYGKPGVSVTGTLEEMQAAIAGKSGVVRFVVEGWNDASGHLDLWHGGLCTHECYFLPGPKPRTTKIELWECA